MNHLYEVTVFHLPGGQPGSSRRHGRHRGRHHGARVYAVRRRREEIFRVARKRKGHRIAAFGSIARGEADPDGDLDLLADFELDASLLDRVGVGVDVVTRSALKPRDDDIRAEAVDL